MLKNLLFTGGNKNESWVASLGGTSVDMGYSACLDKKGNVIITGYANTAGSDLPQGAQQAILAKYNTKGEILWQRALGTTTGACAGLSIDISDDDFIYIGGYYKVNAPYGASLIAKYDLNGTLIWQRFVKESSNSQHIDSSESSSICAGNDGYVYLSGYVYTYDKTSGYVSIRRSRIVRIDINGSSCKYNSKSLFGSANTSVKMRPNGGSFFVGTGNVSNGHIFTYTDEFIGDFYIAINSPNPVNNMHALYPKDTVVSPDGFIYVCANSNINPFGYVLFKFDSNFNMVWQKCLVMPRSHDCTGMCIDTNGYVYVCGNYNLSDDQQYTCIVAKFNSSGVLLWQKLITSTDVVGGNISLSSIRCSKDKSLYLCGNISLSSTSFGTNIMLAKLTYKDIENSGISSVSIGPVTIQDIDFDIIDSPFICIRTTDGSSSYTISTQAANLYDRDPKFTSILYTE